MKTNRLAQLAEEKIIGIVRGIPKGRGIETAEALRADGISFLEITIGFINGDSVKAIPHVVSQVIDTVGAGDAFAAGFLSIYLDENAQMTELSLERALARANYLGAMATQSKGDWEGVPTINELKFAFTGNSIKR